MASENGHPFACMVARKVDGQRHELPIINIGWSLCNPKNLFYKSRGLQIARGRAVCFDTGIKVPRHRFVRLRNELDKFTARATAFFRSSRVRRPAQVYS